MTPRETDHKQAKRALRTRALWTMLGMAITLIVFAVLFAQLSVD